MSYIVKFSNGFLQHYVVWKIVLDNTGEEFAGPIFPITSSNTSFKSLFSLITSTAFIVLAIILYVAISYFQMYCPYFEL